MHYPYFSFFINAFKYVYVYIGLTPTTRDLKTHKHILQMANFSLRLRSQLNTINLHSFNNFKMRIGMNVGPVVAGVIGARFDLI